MSEAPAEQNKKHLCFVDEAWTHAFGLSEANAMDYFAMSMFYDNTSNNQAIRTQGAPTSQLLHMTGIEYTLESIPGDPPVFIIKKQNRVSPQVATVLEVYYIVRGVIYQSPSLMDVSNTRLLKTCLYLNNALSMMAQEHAYSNQGGHTSFIPDPSESVETSPEFKTELIARELPSMEPIISDIEKFCGAIHNSES